MNQINSYQRQINVIPGADVDDAGGKSAGHLVTSDKFIKISTNTKAASKEDSLFSRDLNDLRGQFQYSEDGDGVRPGPGSLRGVGVDQLLPLGPLLREEDIALVSAVPAPAAECRKSA